MQAIQHKAYSTTVQVNIGGNTVPLEVQVVIVAIDDGNVYVGTIEGKEVTSVDIGSVMGFGVKLPKTEAEAIRNAWGITDTTAVK